MRATSYSGGAQPPGIALWPGHQPGKTYVGSSNADDANVTSPIAIYRTYYAWGDDTKEDNQITADHASDCIPWVSFKPPNHTPDDWPDITAGMYDDAIRAKARRYASYDKPVLVTFHHEPVGDGPYANYVPAFLHMFDVMEDEVGNLNNVTFLPIYNGYFWADWYGSWDNTNPNHGSPWDWATDEIMARCPLIGWDFYALAPEIAQARQDIQAHGIQGFAMGEFGRAFIGGRQFTDAENDAIYDEFRAYPDFYQAMCFYDSGGSGFGSTADGPNTGIPIPLNQFNDWLASSCYISDLQQYE